MPVKMPKNKQKSNGTKNASPKPSNGSPKTSKTSAVKDTDHNATSLEPIVSFEWHHAVAFGVFLSIYIKCTAGSIPSGDAGELGNGHAWIHS